MNDKFDELTKGMAQSVTRRGALKQFGIGVVSITFATLGLANKASAGHQCTSGADCHGKVKNICHQGRCVSCVPYAVCDCSLPYGGCGAQDYACIQCCGPYCG